MKPLASPPWKQRENNPRNVASTQPDGSTHAVAVFAHATDAAFAVHAANCHDDMLKALKAMVLNMKNDGGQYRDCFKAAAQSIAKAEGTR